MSARPPARRITGERVVTPEGGFNPTWQRHVAAYELCAGLLPAGRVLDLGCGIGHSYGALAPRETVGVDIDPAALAGQGRETHVADMRALPFADASFDSVLAVQSLEHVADSDRVLAEADRVLVPSGTAIFVTPNRLTFGPADEIVDPYHHVEFAPTELRALCAGVFEQVELRGIAGSPRYLGLVAIERRKLDRALRLDPVGLRRAVPRRLRQRLYDRMLARQRNRRDPAAERIGTGDFTLAKRDLEQVLDLVAICRSRSG